jgi:hypothetical protein
MLLRLELRFPHSGRVPLRRQALPEAVPIQLEQTPKPQPEGEVPIDVTDEFKSVGILTEQASESATR